MYSHSSSCITDHIPPRAGTVLYPGDTVITTQVTSHLVVLLDVFGDFTVMDQKSKGFFRAVARETGVGKN